MTDPKLQIIYRAQCGDVRAFETLIFQHDAQIMQLIYNMVHSPEDARDLYQDVFMKAYQNIRKFRADSSFETWLYRIAVNTCLNFRKARTRRQYTLLDETAHSSQQGRPEQDMIRTEISDRIKAAINQLSPKQRAVFVLRHYHDRKLSEIADMLNCTEGTVKNYLFRATQRLRTELHDLKEDEQS